MLPWNTDRGASIATHRSDHHHPLFFLPSHLARSQILVSPLFWITVFSGHWDAHSGQVADYASL